MATLTIFNGRKNKAGKKTSYKTLTSIKRLLDYIKNPEKTNENLMGGTYCNSDNTYEEFLVNKNIWGKLDNERKNARQVIHFSQNFEAEEKMTPELAKEIAQELLQNEQFKGFQVFYAVHKDKEHIHTHFVVNTVNYETGYKWQLSREGLNDLMNYNGSLCRQHGLKQIELGCKDKKTDKSQNTGEYYSTKNKKSWKFETYLAIKKCSKMARNKEEFIQNMNKLGYKVRWDDNRKNITFTPPGGRPIRDQNLGGYSNSKNEWKVDKESLEKKFSLNNQMYENQQEYFHKYQTNLKIDFVRTGIRLASGEQYPLQNPKGSTISKSNGQASKDRMKEAEKGEGLEW